MSAGTATNWVRPPLDGRRASDVSNLSFASRSPLFGATPFQGLHTGHDIFLSKVRVAADFSDSVPDSSKYFGNPGYHPLEEVKDDERTKNKMLSDAEIARTTIEANNNTLLIFPGTVHCEPHKHASWGDFQYVIDDYGDIFVEIFDDENILLDRAASNHVTALVGMDTIHYGERRGLTSSYNYSSDSETILGTSSVDDQNEVKEVSDVTVDWGISNASHQIHPIYFAKCLVKVAQTKHVRKMDNPSNSVSIMGCLRPAFVDEVSYIRRFFHGEDGDSDLSDWRDEAVKEEEQMSATYDLTDGEIIRFNSKGRERIGSTLYKLEILNMELFSLYGNQSTIDLQDFQDAEPDVLVYCAPNIMERFNGHEVKCDVALKALCRKKKGIIVERACLVGIDSLGMDVRVLTGVEAQTLRFSFNARTTSENAAEKKIRRMLFPRSHKRNLNARSDSHKDLESL